jgi:hypothetical protein
MGLLQFVMGGLMHRQYCAGERQLAIKVLKRRHQAL